MARAKILKVRQLAGRLIGAEPPEKLTAEEEAELAKLKANQTTNFKQLSVFQNEHKGTQKKFRPFSAIVKIAPYD